MALTFGQDLTVAGNIKLTDVDKVSGAYRTIASSSLTASLLTTPQRLEHGQIIYIDSENKLVRVSKITDESFNTTITFPNFTWPGSGAGGNPAAISGAFAEASGGLATRTQTLETTMTSEQTNIDNLQTVQSSQNIDIINLENKVNQSVKTDASPTFVAVNTGQGANELYEMDQNVKTTDSPTFVNITSKGNVVVEGMLVAKDYIISSSKTHMTTSFSSGSTAFGDTMDDLHQFSGSLRISGSGAHYIQTGDVGIGTTNPVVGVDIHKSMVQIKEANASLRLSGTAGGGKPYDIKSAGGQLVVRDVNNGKDRLTVATSGNVGIGDGNAQPNELLNVKGTISASGDFRSNVTSTASFGRVEFVENLSGSYHSTASFGRLEVNANTISIGGTEIKKSVADNITTLDTPLSTTSEPQFAGLKLTSTASISEFTGSSFNFNATNAANLLSVYDESNALVMKVGKGLMVLGAQATAPAPEAGGFFYSGSGNPGEDDFYLGFE